MQIKVSSEILKYLRLYKLELSILVLALGGVSGALLMLGRAFKYLVDYGLHAKQLDKINESILSISILIFIFSISSFVRAYFINSIAEKVINKIRVNVYTKLLEFEIIYFEDLKIGDVISRLTSDIDQIGKLITDFLSFFIRNTIMLLGGVVLMFEQSPKLSLIAIAIISIAIIPLLKFGRYIRGLTKTALQAKGELAANLEETFSNIRTIYAFNQEKNKVQNFNREINHYLASASIRLKARSLFFAIAISIILFSVTMVIWVGSSDIVKGIITSGEMLSFIYYAMLAGMSAGGVAEVFSELQAPLASAERVFALIARSPLEQILINSPKDEERGALSLRQNEFKSKLTEQGNLREHRLDAPNAFVSSSDTMFLDIDSTVPLAVEFNEAEFSYPSRKNIRILRNICYDIKKGNFVGVAGQSGSGKSTLFQLLLKFYPLNSGNIKLYGKDISLIDANLVRRLIAYVPQDPGIFSESVRFNIAFSNPSASAEKVEEIAIETGIMDFVQDFKQGLDTKIGAKGVQLSGGQKQRIAIARALLYNPEILLLDEAMSALDSNSEQKLLQIINVRMKNKTVISIAHRISSIEKADKILVLEKGTIIASGSHEELLKSSKYYEFLCAEQAIFFDK